MASRTLDAEIDRLYQLPLDEFTPARNALAKGAGGEAARVRALSKPPVAAWAVNQLYWRKTEVWNALLAAAENAHRVQRAVLAGRAGDVRAASKVHDGTIRCSWISHIGPMQRFNLLRGEVVEPRRTQTHINEDFHFEEMATSNSFDLHAAYASASLMSSASRYG